MQNSQIQTSNNRTEKKNESIVFPIIKQFIKRGEVDA